jgi:hypothetical protein
MIAWMVVIGAGLVLGVLIEYTQRRANDRAERERARESRRRLLHELRRHA